MANVGNPFYDIYAGLWTMLEADADFAATVHPGNRIKFTAASEHILSLK